MRKALLLAGAAAAATLAAIAPAAASSDASGHAYDSPGVLSGNVVQVPVHVPVNACGITADAVGVLNPAFGNTCIN